jgi:DNA-binding beta-propeller fold protein YncE
MNRFFCFLILLSLFSCGNKKNYVTLQVPGANRYCEINTDGESVIPSGRVIKPAGELIRISPDPFELGLSPDGSLALAVHNNSLTLINTQNLKQTKSGVPYEGEGSYMGAAIRKDNSIAYLSGGNHGDIIYFNLKKKVNKRIFDLQKALDLYDADFRWESLKESPEMDSEEGFRSSHNEQ